MSMIAHVLFKYYITYIFKNNNHVYLTHLQKNLVWIHRKCKFPDINPLDHAFTQIIYY
jgi:hypothetical protein